MVILWDNTSTLVFDISLQNKPQVQFSLISKLYLLKVDTAVHCRVNTLVGTKKLRHLLVSF